MTNNVVARPIDGIICIFNVQNITVMHIAQRINIIYARASIILLLLDELLVFTTQIYISPPN